MMKKILKLSLGLSLVLTFTAVADLQSKQSIESQLEQTLTRIKQKDDLYKAVIAIDPQVKKIAKSLDEARNSNIEKQTGVFGMPILVKDNIDIQGMATTAGSLALRDNISQQDAPIIASLRQSGAIILGKTNLSEWANFRSEYSASGWSGVGGQTRNAFDDSRSPCGSSSGSAVAVALGYVDVAIGTETHGSIVCPASINGVVGIKPTHGLLSNQGIVPLASSQDTAGPIANSVELAALTLAHMIDSEQISQQAKAVKDGLLTVSNSSKIEIKKVRIGVVSSMLGHNKQQDKIFNTAVKHLKSLGVVIVEDNIALNDTPEGFWDGNYQKLQYEFKRDLNQYFKGRGKAFKHMTLANLIKFNKQNAETELLHFDQSIFELSNQVAMTQKQHADQLALERQVTAEQGLDAIFEKHQLDAVIGITEGPAWMIDHINGDSFFGSHHMSAYPAIAGNPHITVPVGKIKGMPIGLSFVGKRYDDHHLAKISVAFSQGFSDIK